jgi:hypothetical protein
MSALHSILRTTHCCSTHHYFAIDALPMVQTDAGKRLVSLLLRHHRRYLNGATDPDTRFRDFQNHVVHVTDGYWGGAPRVAHQWYDRLQRYLREHRYSDAAHAAGVLSHYFTDPMQPLHTQQCERERVLHRPIEWSIANAYDEILCCWREDELRVVFQLSGGPAWLGEAILHGARFANRRYRQLLEGYDLETALTDPAAALNDNLKGSMSELFGLAITGWARVLERAAADAEAIRGCALPNASMTLPTLVAVLRAPLRRWTRQTAFRREQRAVRQLVEEFRATGDLQKHLPVEVDIVHRVVRIRQEERDWKQRRDGGTASEPADAAIDGAGESPRTVPFVQSETGRGKSQRDLPKSSPTDSSIRRRA